MPVTPDRYKDRYLPVTFSGCAGRGQQQVHIRTYLSSFASANATYRERAYKDLRRFILREAPYDDPASGAEHYYWGSGWVFSTDLRPTPWAWIDLGLMKSHFQGTGRPIDKERIMRMVDLYLHTANMDTDHLGWGKKLKSRQDYADWYMGLDCRGFVAAYLDTQYPAVRLPEGPGFSIDSYNKGAYGFHKNKKGSSFTRIDKVGDVRVGDLLVKCNAGDGRRHVALVNSVGAAGSKSVTVTTAESASSKGGLCNKTSTLTRIRTSHSSEPNVRHWKHAGVEYNFVLQPR